MLRRPCCDSSGLDHASTPTHADKEAELFGRRTGRVGCQQKIGKFLTITKSKQVKDSSIDKDKKGQEYSRYSH